MGFLLAAALTLNRVLVLGPPSLLERIPVSLIPGFVGAVFDLVLGLLEGIGRAWYSPFLWQPSSGGSGVESETNLPRPAATAAPPRLPPYLPRRGQPRRRSSAGLPRSSPRSAISARAHPPRAELLAPGKRRGQWCRRP